MTEATEPDVWKWELGGEGGGGGNENRTYRRPFTSAVRASLAGSPWALSSPRKKMNLGLAYGEMQFPAATALRGVTLLSRSCVTLSAPPPRRHFSMQIWTNYKTHNIFKKREGPQPPVAPPVDDSVVFCPRDSWERWPACHGVQSTASLQHAAALCFIVLSLKIRRMTDTPTTQRARVLIIFVDSASFNVAHIAEWSSGSQ